MKTKHLLNYLVCLMTAIGVAQQKADKLSKSITANSDVTIDLNTNYVEIEIETWSKNTVEVEAYMESEKLSKDELQKALKAWGLEVTGSGDYISIKSLGSRGRFDLMVWKYLLIGTKKNQCLLLLAKLILENSLTYF